MTGASDLPLSQFPWQADPNLETLVRVRVSRLRTAARPSRDQAGGISEGGRRGRDRRARAYGAA